MYKLKKRGVKYTLLLLLLRTLKVDGLTLLTIAYSKHAQDEGCNQGIQCGICSNCQIGFVQWNRVGNSRVFKIG